MAKLSLVRKYNLSCLQRHREKPSIQMVTPVSSYRLTSLLNLLAQVAWVRIKSYSFEAIENVVVVTMVYNLASLD